VILVSENRARATLALNGLRSGIRLGWPHNGGAGYTDDVAQSSFGEAASKITDVSVARVCEDDVPANSSAKRVVQERQADTPLLTKGYLFGDT
jgi:hypothetical protein